MQKVVALRSDNRAIYRAARALAWKSLTWEERKHVIAVEEDPALFGLFNALLLDYQQTHWFTVPTGLSPFETDALHVMHRFVDELACHITTLQEVKDFVTDFQYGQHHMPA